MRTDEIADPACGSARILLTVSNRGEIPVRLRSLSLSMCESDSRPNIFLSFNRASLTEDSAELRRTIRQIESTVVIDGQRRVACITSGGCAGFGDPIWDKITEITPESAFRIQDFRLRLHHLRQAYRLTRILLTKLAVFFRTPVLSFKKAVSERRFFVLHETHPPAGSALTTGLLVGAFQAV